MGFRLPSEAVQDYISHVTRDDTLLTELLHLQSSLPFATGDNDPVQGTLK
ncbi:MAG: hypothetical protein RL385_2087, partial [Pseudomonadota bacterium]